MTTKIYSKTDTQSVIQVNGFDSLVFDNQGLVFGSNSLGTGQTFQNVLASRSNGVTYYNTTNKPIAVAVGGYSSGGNCSLSIVVAGFSVMNPSTSAANNTIAVFAVVPPGASYVATITGAATLVIPYWTELR